MELTALSRCVAAFFREGRCNRPRRPRPVCTYDFTVANTGHVTLTDVAVTDTPTPTGGPAHHGSVVSKLAITGGAPLRGVTQAH